MLQIARTQKVSAREIVLAQFWKVTLPVVQCVLRTGRSKRLSWRKSGRPIAGQKKRRAKRLLSVVRIRGSRLPTSADFSLRISRVSSSKS